MRPGHPQCGCAPSPPSPLVGGIGALYRFDGNEWTSGWQPSCDAISHAEVTSPANM